MITKKLLSLLTIGTAAFVIFTASNFPKDKNSFVNFDKKLYAAPYEVTNKEYRDFLTDIKSKDADAFKKSMYDSTQWMKKFSSAFNEPLVNAYHWHPAYDNYPIVNITPDAAKAYCEWLTNKYNNNPKREYKKVIYRLPTEKEWMTFSSPLPGHNLPWYGNLPYTDQEGKTILTNIKIKDLVTDKNNYVFDGAFHSIIVGHYKPNSIGLYDVIGNVSEMTSDGKLKGGSWDNYLDECTIDKTQSYNVPDPRVGFRVVMEVVEE